MPDENDFISGIFNYCDRWCERCDYTTRCRVFAKEAERDPEELDTSLEEALDVVAESFAEAKQLLLEHAEEQGIDIDAVMNDPEVEEIIGRTTRKVDDDPAVQISKKYALDLAELMKSPEAFLLADAEDDPTVKEMLEIISWYQFFITAKIHGALHSGIDLDAEDDLDQLNDPQSDANGRAKVALIAIERSILAWTYLLTDANAPIIRPLIEMLEESGRLVEDRFPHARAFIRPGFDEVEAVM